ncbi:MAG: SCO family protein [Myxococcota bacterium]|nr:SCO family protein [Myxococcota bacterium]MDW8363388.1 SCO family protein [Myxococcales bacterium]
MHDHPPTHPNAPWLEPGHPTWPLDNAFRATPPRGRHGVACRWPKVVFVVTMAACRPSAEPLPELGAVPSFELVTADERPLRREDLHGRLTVVSFLFTRCPTVCPVLVERLRMLHERLGPRRGSVRILSISIDPEHDRPPVLRDFVRARGLPTEHWTFATGSSDELVRAVAQGFRIAVGERRAVPGAPGGFDITHGTHLVLVDGRGRIRAYHASDEEGLTRLLADIDSLLAEGRP